VSRAGKNGDFWEDMQIRQRTLATRNQEPQQPLLCEYFILLKALASGRLCISKHVQILALLRAA
jgi:hypothetical protein